MKIFKMYRHMLVGVASAFLLMACATNENKQFASTDEIEIFEEYGVDSNVREDFKNAIALMREQKYEDAIKLLKRVTAETEKHSAPYINLGIAYSNVNNPEDAEKSLLKALQINPKHPVSNNELGILYRKMGRFNEAKVSYENALKPHPNFLPARKNLGVLCDLYLNDVTCALSNYETYLKSVPTDKDVKIWVAALKLKSGN